jgi:hypothetical protein
MAARKMMAAKGEGVYWQTVGNADKRKDCSLRQLPQARRYRLEPHPSYALMIQANEASLKSSAIFIEGDATLTIMGKEQRQRLLTECVFSLFVAFFCGGCRSSPSVVSRYMSGSGLWA